MYPVSSRGCFQEYVCCRVITTQHKEPLSFADKMPGGEHWEFSICLVFKMHDKNTNADFNF